MMHTCASTLLWNCYLTPSLLRANGENLESIQTYVLFKHKFTQDNWIEFQELRIGTKTLDHLNQIHPKGIPSVAFHIDNDPASVSVDCMHLGHAVLMMRHIWDTVDFKKIHLTLSWDLVPRGFHLEILTGPREIQEVFL